MVKTSNYNNKIYLGLFVLLTLVTLTIVSTLSFSRNVNINASNADNWSSRPNDLSFEETGNGRDAPFFINSAEQLATIARNIETYAGYNYVLANNIDLSEYYWTPIGNDTQPFYGGFGGLGHTISGLKISKEQELTYAGLFGKAGGATIKNLNLNVETIVANTSENWSYAGGLVASLSGGSEISGIRVNEGNILAYGQGECAYAGGVIGMYYASENLKLNNLFNYANATSISTRFSKAGGISSGAYSYAREMNLTFSNLKNSGNINAFSSSDAGYNYAGGIFGWLRENTSVEFSANDGDIQAGTYDSSFTFEETSYVTKTPISSWAGGITGFRGSIKNAMNLGNIKSYANTYQSYEFSPLVTGGANTDVYLTKKSSFMNTDKYYFNGYWYDKTGKSEIKQDGIGWKEEAYAGGITGQTLERIENVYSDADIRGGVDRTTFNYITSCSIVRKGTWSTTTTYVHQFTNFKIPTKYYHGAITGNRDADVANAYGNNSFADNKITMSIYASKGNTGRFDSSYKSSNYFDLSTGETYETHSVDVNLSYYKGFYTKAYISNNKLNLWFYQKHYKGSSGTMKSIPLDAINYEVKPLTQVNAEDMAETGWSKTNLLDGRPYINTLYW